MVLRRSTTSLENLGCSKEIAGDLLNVVEPSVGGEEDKSFALWALQFPIMLNSWEPCTTLARLIPSLPLVVGSFDSWGGGLVFKGLGAWSSVWSGQDDKMIKMFSSLVRL